MAMSAGLQVAVGLYFYKRDPQVVARRLQRHEQIGVQKFLITLFKILYVGSLILCGFDFRFGWTRTHFGPLPWWVSGAALAFIAAADIWYMAVLKANSFASSTIRVEAGQPIVAGGLYGLVRHPMYLGFMVTGVVRPLALGSLVVLPVACLIIPLLAFRLLNEEQFLRRELPGYSDYCQQTRWRLIPFVW
jgi:protein-S-isoprenylcysteine O-methyltransferase Ste14